MGQHVGVESTEQPPSSAAHRPRLRFHWRLGRDVSLVILTTLAAIGAVIGASTGINSLRQVNSISAAQTQLLDGTADEAAKAADSNPSNAHLTLVSTNRQQYVDAVIGASHREGYLLKSNLEGAGSGRGYQLWARTPGGSISVGLAGSSIGALYFSVPVSATSIFITNESDRGAIQPTGSPLVEGNVERSKS